MKVSRFMPFLLGCLLTFSLSSQDDENDLSEVTRILEDWLSFELAFNQYPGFTAAAVNDQKIVWSGAFGMANKEEGVSSQTSTIYSICSISKLFTAIAIMQLRDEGKLSLEDHVTNLLPWYDLPQVHENSGPITVRGLMTHSSGLPRESNHPYWTGPDFPFPESDAIRSELKNQQTLYPASQYFQYSNLGLTLLGAIVEEVSGQPYDAYVSEHILQPLGLSSTASTLPEDKYGQEMAIGYSALTRDRKRNKVKLFDARGIGPAAGYSSTVEDLAKFTSWQFKLLDEGGHHILRSSTLKEMQNVHFMDPNWRTTWGLGFAVRQSGNETLVGHGGSCPGYRSQLMLNPKKKHGAVVMFNSGGVNTNKYVMGIGKILNMATSPSADSLNLEDYAGTYSDQPWGTETGVYPLGGKLVTVSYPTSDPAGNMLKMKHIEGDVFRRIRSDDELGEEIRFERNNEGEVTHLVRHNNRIKTVSRD